MTDRPILFTAPMVRALLAGRKTQTRRAPARWAKGDRLWVREAWAAPVMYDELPPRDLPIGCARAFIADGAEIVGFGDAAVSCPIGAAGRDRVSFHLPRWASRITLEVTDAREEALHEISEDDALAEGVHVELLDGKIIYMAHPDDDCGWDDARHAYWSLWESINGPVDRKVPKRVAALTFTVTHANIDAVPA